MLRLNHTQAHAAVPTILAYNPFLSTAPNHSHECYYNH